jgi:hypothetical protein
LSSNGVSAVLEELKLSNVAEHRDGIPDRNESNSDMIPVCSADMM